MITRVVDHVIDPAKTAHRSVRIRRMALVEQHCGTHHGYFLPSEGPAIAPSPCSPPQLGRLRAVP